MYVEKMSKYKLSLIVSNILIVAVATPIIMFVFVPFINRPELIEQVDIIATEERASSSGSNAVVNFIVTFELSDGSEMVLRVSRGARGRGREVFDAMRVGDSGRLTYIERENFIERFPLDNRRFISFERGVEHGFYIIESVERPPESEFFMLMILVVAILLVVNVGTVVLHRRFFPSVKKSTEITENVEVVDRKLFMVTVEIQQVRYNVYEFIIIFRFSDGSERYFEVPEDIYYLILGDVEKYRAHMENVNDKIIESYKAGQMYPRGFYYEEGNALTLSGAGKLTYKEIENIERKFKDESKQWKGRLFVSFEPEN